MFHASGNGHAETHFDSARFEQVVTRFQSQRDVASLTEIVTLTQRRAEVLIRFNGTTSYRTEPELLSDINFKLLRSVAKYDPQKGSAFTYISKIIDSSLRTAVTNQRRYWSRNVELDDEIVNTVSASDEDRSSADDLAHRIRCKARTLLIDARELEAQRWYVDSFCDDGFNFRRHACADACMSVYQLGHSRSRELFDLTMLEARRVLYDDVKRKEQIIPGQLYGTRSHWMTRYQSLLTPDEFTRFHVLMKNLAPYLMLLIVDPTKANNHRRDRNPTIGRETIKLILYGHPEARPLFPVTG
jgi:hypothetical protein